MTIRKKILMGNIMITLLTTMLVILICTKYVHLNSSTFPKDIPGSNEGVNALTRTRTELSTLEQLSYADWQEASVEKKKFEKQIGFIEQSIEKASDSKAAADKKLNAIAGELKALEAALIKQTEDEKKLKSELDSLLFAKGFDSPEDMLGFVVSENELSEAEADELFKKFGVPEQEFPD